MYNYYHVLNIVEKLCLEILDYPVINKLKRYNLILIEKLEREKILCEQLRLQLLHIVKFVSINICHRRQRIITM